MITLNITIGGNLLIELDRTKEAKQELKELIEKAANTDDILTDLLEISKYRGNDWYAVQGVLTEAPIVTRGSFFINEDELEEDYEDIWFYSEYQLKSFSRELLKNGKVVFKRFIE